MRLTAFGVKSALFYLAMAGVFAAAPYSNLGFLLLAFLTLQWLFCAAWTLRNLRGVTAEVRGVNAVPVGSAEHLPAVVRAAGRRARFRVVVEVEFAAMNEAGALSAAPCARAEAALVIREAQVELALPPLARGVYAVRGARVASSYPLGLFARRRAIAAPAELVVYPAPADLVAARSGADALSELLGRGAPGAGDLQPAGLRDHRDGDELRAVHWRASARRGSLVVREWESGGGQGLEVLLDRRCDAERLDGALAVISALVGLARTNKEVLQLHTQGLQAKFGEGHRPWGEALRFLATADALPAGGPPPPPVSPSVARLPASRSRPSPSRPPRSRPFDAQAKVARAQ